MIDKAIAKITDEMMKIDTPLAQGIEEHLTGICKSEAVAEKILNPEKKLSDICKKVTDEARKRAKGGVAYIPPEEVFRMVDEYYGIGTERPKEHIDIMDLL